MKKLIYILVIALIATAVIERRQKQKVQSQLPVKTSRVDTGDFEPGDTVNWNDDHSPIRK
ncbi:MAG TPA: hypothetical protein VGN20_19230 [Mucilaginibacter sp.]|jgi:hypothetical protein